jgi:quinol monooxygenase YgiN
MTITAYLDIRIKPESLDGAAALITDVLTATRSFDGNLGVEVLIDEADPTHMVLVETWESPRHDAAYRDWRSTPAGASGLADILSDVPVLTLYKLAADI